MNNHKKQTICSQNITGLQYNQTYTVSQKMTLTLHTNLNAHQPILVIFGRDIAEYTIRWRFVISLLLANVSALPGEI